MNANLYGKTFFGSCSVVLKLENTMESGGGSSDCFLSYLSNKQQYVSNNDINSEVKPMLHGEPESRAKTQHWSKTTKSMAFR